MKSIHSIDDVASKRGGRAILDRMRWIDDRIHYFGSVGRMELCSRFEISPQAGSNDLTTFAELAGPGVEARSKAYFRTPAWQPLFPKDGSAFLRWLDPSPDELAVERLSSGIAQVLDGIIASVAFARLVKRPVDLHSDDGSKLTLSPHAIIDAGKTLFVRGWDHEVRKFLAVDLGLVTAVELSHLDSWIDATEDLEWQDLVEITVRPGKTMKVRRPLAVLYGIALPAPRLPGTPRIEGDTA